MTSSNTRIWPFVFSFPQTPMTSQLCPPVGLNPTDPDREDEATSQIGTCFITDRFSLRVLRRMYNADQCGNERQNEKAQEGKKVVEIKTDPDWR